MVRVDLVVSPFPVPAATTSGADGADVIWDSYNETMLYRNAVMQVPRAGPHMALHEYEAGGPARRLDVEIKTCSVKSS